MKIKDIVLKSLTFVGLDDLVDGVKTATSTTSAVEPVEKLVRVCENVLCEIAEGYVPLITREPAAPSNGKIKYGALSQDVAKITGVFDLNGIPVDYTLEIDGIRVATQSSVFVEYRYYPKSYDLNSEIIFDGCAVSAKTVAYGVAADYFTADGDYALANVWNKKFYESLSAQLRRKGLKLKARRWI